MKILIPILGFGKSGGNRVLSRLATELKKRGSQVDFLAPANSQLPYFPTTAGCIWVNEHGEITKEPSDNFTAKLNFFNIQKSLFRGLGLELANEYDVILLNHSLTTIAAFYTRHKRRSVYYVQAYEPDYYKLEATFRNTILRILSLLSYKLGFYTIVNAEIYRNYKWLKAKEVIMPGLDLTIFQPKGIIFQGKQKHFNSSEIIRVGTIGRPEKQKGTIYILEAFKSLSRKYSNIELHVAFSSANDWEMLPNTYYSHPDGDEALAIYYQSLDLYISAGISQIGAVHYPVIECMACGVTVITTPYYPASETNAWIIQPQSANSIATAVTQAVTDFEATTEKKIKAIESVKQFDWSIIGQKMYSSFQKIIVERG